LTSSHGNNIQSVCAQVRRLLAAGELSDKEIAQVVPTTMSNIRSVRARMTRPARAARTARVIAEMDAQISQVLASVSAIAARVTALELKLAQTSQRGAAGRKARLG